MQKRPDKKRDAQMYRTNLLIPTVTEDPIMGMIAPRPIEDVEDAKHRVDENEK